VSIRVLLVDDQPLLRRGFSMLLGTVPDIDVVGEAANGAEAVELFGELRPDVTLMDIRMPKLDGIEATRRILRSDQTAKIILLTTFDLDEYAFEGLSAGASGFLLKDALPEELVAAIRNVAAGDAVIAPSTTRRLLRSFAKEMRGTAGGERASGDSVAGDGALAQLTQRETEVFAEVVMGLSNAEIAGRLMLSEATVKTHVGRILTKLGLRDRIQAVIFAYEHGLSGPRRG
jgi:DNA-binding NarL/FixJ family response regulator